MRQTGALASPFLELELFQSEADPRQSARVDLLQAESAFRLGVATEALVESEIIGTNDMDAVASSLAVPHRWICRLDIDYDITPFGSASRLTGSGRGTGTLISPCHVLTAAHNLVEYDAARKNTLRAVRIRVTPAHDGSASPPVATVEADLSQSSTHPQWDIARRHDVSGAAVAAGEVETNRYDYALLTLKSAIGDSQVRGLGAPLGYWGDQGSGGAVRFERLDPAMLRGQTVFVAGYGADDCVRAARTARGKPGIRFGSQLMASGQITLVMEATGAQQYVGRSMVHDADTCGGQSGAPVALLLNGIYYLVGVHTAGVALTAGGRTNHAVRVTREVVTQVNGWMTGAPCPAAGRELEDGRPDAGEQLAAEQLAAAQFPTEPLTAEQEDLEPESLERGSDAEIDRGVIGAAPDEWAMEWAGEQSEEPLSGTATEQSEEHVTQEYDTPPMTLAISDAVERKDWPRVLELAMQVGWHDENPLTNLLFYSRHTDLDRRSLDPGKNPADRKLAEEWTQIRNKEVRPAIQKASEDSSLEVSGNFVAERDPELSGAQGAKFREMVASAARDVDMDPGFLAAVLLAEVGSAAPYLRTSEVRSFFTGTDDFFAQRAQLRANVPVFSKVHFDASKKTTSINEHGREVTTIPYRTGQDAALATAVYLKWGEIKIRRAMQKKGQDFGALPSATRFVLVRVAMAAGHGGISPDGDLIRFKKKAGKVVAIPASESGGILLGVATTLDRVLNGQDVLVRGWEPRKDPTNDSHITHRNATILASQAIHLGDWFFRAPALGVQPELEEAPVS